VIVCVCVCVCVCMKTTSHCIKFFSYAFGMVKVNDQNHTLVFFLVTRVFITSWIICHTSDSDIWFQRPYRKLHERHCTEIWFNNIYRTRNNYDFLSLHIWPSKSGACLYLFLATRVYFGVTFDKRTSQENTIIYRLSATSALTVLVSWVRQNT
jgi:hypothetical protein